MAATVADMDHFRRELPYSLLAGLLLLGGFWIIARTSSDSLGLGLMVVGAAVAVARAVVTTRRGLRGDWRPQDRRDTR